MQLFGFFIRYAVDFPIRTIKKGGLLGGYLRKYIDSLRLEDIVDMKDNKDSIDSKTKKDKKRLDVYKTIWDIDIVVANKYVTLEDLKEKYEYDTDKELDDFITDGCATTCTVIDKKTKALCCLVKYNRKISRNDIDPHLDIITTAVHEAVHCVLDIYSQSSVDIHYNNQEPVAYEIASVTVNILKTLLNK